MNKIASILVLAGVLFGTVSCQHFQRARECRAVAKVVNPALTSIRLQRAKAPEDPASYRLIATTYDRLAYSLIGLQTQNKRVLDAALDYGKLAKEASHDARLYADALQAKDDARVLQAKTSAGKTAKHEAGAVAHFESVCRSK